jgi:sugar-specific transcriptional regulator TrmB
LRSIGLSKNETEIYIILGKQGPLKSGQIAKHLKMNRGQVYRIMRNLKKKGLVEETLESPARFIAIPLDKVIDSYLRSRQEEVARIEEKRKDLLSDWENIRQTELASPLEKFFVIEGKNRIFKKIYQMIKETKNQFSMKMTPSNLFQMERSDLFDNFDYHSNESEINFRVLTQISKQNLKAIKALKKTLPPILDFRGKNPSLGSPKFYRMAIRDNDEIVLFISDENQESLKGTLEVCLCTNCKSIIEAFLDLFEDSWKNSREIEDWINEIETGRIPKKTQIIKDPLTAKNFYFQVLDSAEEEILIITSSKGLIELLDNRSRLQEWQDRGIIVRIMAPIINENLNAVQKLLNFCEIRHIPIGYLETTIIDDCHLFQFKSPQDESNSIQTTFFDNTYYTNDINSIKKTKTMLFDIWKKTKLPPVIAIESITSDLESTRHPIFKMDTRKVLRRVTVYGSIKDEIGLITQEEVLNKFNKAKKYPITDYDNKKTPVVVRYFGTAAFAMIHPPKHFELPPIIIGVCKHNHKSSFGIEDVIYVHLLNNKEGNVTSKLVTVLHNNPEATEFRKFYSGGSTKTNVKLLRENQLNIRRGGNSLFVGWTVPIPLIPSKHVLPPSCLLFEGYGKVKSGVMNMIVSSRKINVVYNYLEAFVTFFHPISRYSSPGTEGFIDTEFVRTSYSKISQVR